MALLQQVAHTSRVVFVHLAAMGLDVQFFAHRASAAVTSPNLFYAIKKGSGLYRDRRAKPRADKRLMLVFFDHGGNIAAP
jgi:hypothetical protein